MTDSASTATDGAVTYAHDPRLSRLLMRRLVVGDVIAIEASATATGTIIDDDVAPSVSVADGEQVTVVDPIPETTGMTFVISLSHPSSRTIQVDYQTRQIVDDSGVLVFDAARAGTDGGSGTRATGDGGTLTTTASDGVSTTISGVWLGTTLPVFFHRT